MHTTTPLEQKQPMFRLDQMMRWYGPHDTVPLEAIRQAGAAGVVTALHHIPVGDVWRVDEIEKRKNTIEAAGMRWSVIESLPVHEDIKTRSGNWQRYVDNYRVSLQNVAACGLKVVTYNFMPVLDWVRTDIAYQLPGGAEALRFERDLFTVFDLFLLKRPGARGEYSETEYKVAAARLESMSPDEQQRLFTTAMLGLPGATEGFTAEQVLGLLEQYRDIDASTLRANLGAFLADVVPTAASLGLRMAIHPDDPPFPLLGLPRVVSTADDLRAIAREVPDEANGFCFCTGSLGARTDNDLPALLAELGSRVHFLHLRNTKRDTTHAGSFYEADHLDGDTDMAAIVEVALDIMRDRGESIPMRPDHGHRMLDDLSKSAYPGYSAIGRLKALAELRGLEEGLVFGATSRART